MLVRVRSPDFRPSHRGGGPGLGVCTPPASGWAGDSSSSGTAPAILGKVLPSSAFQCPPSMNGIWGGERKGRKGTRSLRTLGRKKQEHWSRKTQRFES